MDTEVRCVCSNPACSGRVDIRKGYVNITHEDGREEVRWDHLWFDTYQGVGDDSKWTELQFSHSDAKYLMWWMVRAYMPVVSRVCDWYKILRLEVFLFKNWFSERFSSAK